MFTEAEEKALERRRGYTEDAIRRATERDRKARAEKAAAVLESEARKILRENGTPSSAIDLAIRICNRQGVSPLDVVGRCVTRNVVHARNEVMYELKREKPSRSMPLIGKWFNRDHTTVMYAIGSHAHRMGLPHLTGYAFEPAKRARLMAARRALERKAASSTQSTGR